MRQSAKVPRRAGRWLLILGGWMLGALFLTGHQTVQIYYGRSSATVGRLLLVHVVSASSWVALTPLILWVSRRFALDKGPLRKQLTAQIVCGLGIVLLQMGFDALILPRLSPRPGRASATFFEAYKSIFLTDFPWNVSIYCTVLGIVFGIRYYRQFAERELRASQLEARLARAQLHALKMQLHPHFLFNTHNAISELIHKDPKVAEQMLSNLSGLLRFSLDNLETEEVVLQQELDFVVKYLEIEQVRFQDRLQVRINVAPETLDALVPNMILQPLVENAIKHGVAPLLRGGTVEVSAAREDGRLHLRVADDGVGAGRAGEIVQGVGLSNTRARLEHLYADFSLEIRPRRDGGTNVSLRIPFRSVSGCGGEPDAGPAGEA
ncbi:MAG TPA: sensor histidine kinase [Pyrinomonadaceae bacterium]